MEQKNILLIGRGRKNLELLSQFLSREGYSTIKANDYESLDRVLENNGEVELSLIDIAGFDSRIWERCEVMRKKGIPFLVISPSQSIQIQKASIEHGAQGTLVKPLAVKEFLSLIKSMMEG
jgi:DNA-binding response OmpR family regulator